MAHEQRHIIHKVSVEVRAGSSMETDVARSKLHQLIYDIILKKIEQYFEAHAFVLENQSFQLDSLSLDLHAGELEGISLKPDIEAQIELQLDRYFTELHLLRQANEQNPEDRAGANLNPTVLRQRLGEITISPKVRVVQTLIHFLETGASPWWVHDYREMQALLSEENLTSVYTVTAMLPELKKTLHQPVPLDRFTTHFPPETVVTILRGLFSAGNNANSGTEIRLSAPQLRRIQQLPVSSRRTFWQLLIKALESSRLSNWETHLTEAILRHFPAGNTATTPLPESGPSSAATKDQKASPPATGEFPDETVLQSVVEHFENTSSHSETLASDVFLLILSVVAENHTRNSDWMPYARQKLKQLPARQLQQLLGIAPTQVDPTPETGTKDEGKHEIPDLPSLTQKAPPEHIDTEPTDIEYIDSERIAPESMHPESLQKEPGQDIEKLSAQESATHPDIPASSGDSGALSSAPETQDATMHPENEPKRSAKTEALHPKFEELRKTHDLQEKQRIEKLSHLQDAEEPGVSPELERIWKSDTSTQKEDQRRPSAAIEPEKGFIAANAGLILLHPFLKAFCEKWELMDEERKLTSPEQMVHVLHYLATGQEHPEEYMLTFEKYICGLDSDTIVERTVDIPEEIKAGADELLQAVLNYWDALKSSSLQLLRNEFLQRPGRIEEKDKQLRITFERKTFDILIDRIPWTIGYLQLPWRKGLIVVEW